MALTPDGAMLVVTNAGADTVSLVDTRTLTVAATVAIRRPGQVDALPATSKISQKLNVRIAPGGRYAWVGDQLGADWAVVDLATRTLAATYPAGVGADIMMPLTRGPMSGLGLGTARYSPNVAVLAPDRPAIAAEVVTAPQCATAGRCPSSITGADGPLGTGSHLVVVNRRATTAYLSDRPGHAVTVFDLRSGQPWFVADIPVGRYPDGIAYLWFDDGVVTTGD